ncbi:peroxisomal membrane protein 2 isoform X2 [Echinops telfairi]|uniref:Peroxisomal membrane protein 2 isoform X2 n=1 Tax=Echinops telfairi TaxID=9371 RepID=A0AC55DM61_ECHTE|nr:peroxisomal membrane protein 2 isoform X2 [Echinops telfairi]
MNGATNHVKNVNRNYQPRNSHRKQPVPRPEGEARDRKKKVCALEECTVSKRVMCKESGFLSALGNFLAQMIEKKRKKENSQDLDVSGPLRYAIYGFFFTGPLSHFFYVFMEHWIPPEVPLAGVKRLLLDRLLFAPAFLLLFFFIMNVLERKDMATFSMKVRRGFWPALQMNWKVWTPIQFINVNYVPVQFRVLFANLVALFWYAYLASLGK